MGTREHETANVPSPRWQRRKDARPSEILAAALGVFVEHGYAATKLEEVASRAGVTKGTLYLYFESKEALFKAAVRETIVPLLAAAERSAHDHTGTPEELLRRLVLEWWRSLDSSQLAGIPKLVMSEAANFPELAQFWFDEVVQRGRHIFAGVVRRGIEDGSFRDVDVDLAVRAVLAPVLMASIWKHSFQACEHERFAVEPYLDAAIDIYLRGVAAPDSTQGDVGDGLRAARMVPGPSAETTAPDGNPGPSGRAVPAGRTVPSTSVAAGASAEVRADAYPRRVFPGHVESHSPATGAKFSLLPPDNATGNFTKIVQRIPVRIRLDAAADSMRLLRPGMSVDVTIRTR
jgi:AcrR family transcriptional regulator